MMATDYHNHSLTSSKHSFSDWMSVGFIHWRYSQFWKKLCERKLKHFNCVLKLDSWHVLNNFTPSLMNFLLLLLLLLILIAGKVIMMTLAMMIMMIRACVVHLSRQLMRCLPGEEQADVEIAAAAAPLHDDDDYGNDMMVILLMMIMKSRKMDSNRGSAISKIIKTREDP